MDEKRTIKPAFFYNSESEWQRQGLGPLPPERDISKLTPAEFAEAREMAKRLSSASQQNAYVPAGNA